MAGKKINIAEELKKIERDERAIMAEERTIEQKEDLIKTFEELGLMRWKSYYVLTAGAILILALSFTLAFWTMNVHLDDMSKNLDSLDAQLMDLKAPKEISKDWCPVGKTITVKGASIQAVKLKEIDGMEVCCTMVDVSDDKGELCWDIKGNPIIL